MKKRIFILIIVLIIIFFSVILIILSRKKQSEESFNGIIFKLDSYLTTNSLDKMELFFENYKLGNFELSQEKRFLKRIFMYSVKSKNYTFLEKYSNEFCEKHPDDLQLKKIHLFSLLKLNRYKQVLQYADDKKYFTDIKPLLEQAFLLFQEAGGKVEGLDLKSDFISVVNGKDPYLYEKAYKITGNEGFKLDKGLLYLKSGNISKGSSVLQDITENYNVSKKILFYTAIENKQFETALHILSVYDLGFEIQTLIQFKAELLLLTGRNVEAFKAYNYLIDNFPDNSPIPYINLLWIWSKNKDLTPPNSVKKGLEYFSDNKILIHNYLRFLILSNKIDDSIKLINLYSAKDPVLELVNINLKGAFDPSYIIARIQEIMLKFPEQEKIRKYYCWFLFYSGYMDKLNAYVKLFDKKNYPEWILPFKGITAVYENKYDQALSFFQKAYNYKNHWEYLFNMGIVYQGENDLKNALEFFQRAELQLSKLPVPPYVDRSMVRYYAAKILEKQENFKGAVKELEYALTLDSENIDADLMLKRLKIKMKTYQE